MGPCNQDGGDRLQGPGCRHYVSGHTGWSNHWQVCCANCRSFRLNALSYKRHLTYPSKRTSFVVYVVSLKYCIFWNFGAFGIPYPTRDTNDRWLLIKTGNLHTEKVQVSGDPMWLPFHSDAIRQVSVCLLLGRHRVRMLSGFPRCRLARSMPTYCSATEEGGTNSLMPGVRMGPFSMTRT